MRSVFLCTLIAAAAGAAYGGAAERMQANAAFQQQNPRSHFYVTPAGLVGRIYGAPFSGGASAEEAAEAFRLTHAGVFGVAAEDLVPGNHFNGNVTQPMLYDRETGEYGATLVYYAQHHDGIPVYRAELRLLASNVDGFPISWAGSSLRDLGDFSAAGDAPVRADLGQQAAEQAVPGLTNFSAPEVVVWAGVDDMVVEPRLAITFIGDNLPVIGEPEKRLFITDAQTGEILYTENLVYHVDVTGNVSAMAGPTGAGSDICATEVARPMPYARVAITGGNAAFADANGNYTIPHGGTAAVTVTSDVRGLYFNVNNQAAADTVLSQNVTPPGPASFVHNSANANELQRAEVNAYIQANVVRDYLLSYNPSHPTIAGQTNYTTNVNIANTCNAFYDGGSINFYRSGGTCPNTAFDTVVHHEFGHHIVQTAGSGQGAYGEGYGDVMGVLITDDHVLARGWNTSNCSAGLRDANNACQYSAASCSDCGSAVHACGRLLSGCVWSLRNNLLGTNPGTYRQILSDLAINSVLLHAGSSSIAPDITVDFLTLDDAPARGGNGDLNDGSPHYSEINGAFTAHNMPGPPISPLIFTYPNGRPDNVDPAGGTTMRVQVSGNTSTPQPNTGRLYYRIGTSGAFTSAAMNPVSTNVYDAVFPAAACGSTVQFYVSARTTGNVEVFNPTNAPTEVYSVLAATGFTPVLIDSFETNLGWTAGMTGDTATTGVWNRMDPQATDAQPGDDHTPAPGTICWVTDGVAGGTLGERDVDGGRTTLLSPVLNLAGASNIRISYWRWYSNDTGGAPNTDTFRVDITNNGTTWVNVETVGPSGPETHAGWFYHEFFADSLVAPTASVRLRFIAEDAGTGSLIEAAVDDFKAEIVECAAACEPCDTNCDGSVNSFDINDFVNALSPNPPAACSPCAGDANGDGSVNSFDINAFVECLGG